jgi:hypothetical protein
MWKDLSAESGRVGSSAVRPKIKNGCVALRGQVKIPKI